MLYQGLAANSTQPLSTPPMRRPCPPASTSPQISAFTMACRLRSEPLRPVKSRKCLPDRAADHRQADSASDLAPHLRQARAGHQERYPHLRGLDHHLRREPARRVEDLVAAVDAIEPHVPRDRVDRVVASDVLDERQDFRAVPTRWTRARNHVRRPPACRWSRAGGRFEQRVQRGLRQRRVVGKADVVDLPPSGRRTPCLARSRSSSCAWLRLRLEVLSPLRVLTTTAPISQSTCTDTMSSIQVTPAAGCAGSRSPAPRARPSVISVTTSRLST